MATKIEWAGHTWNPTVGCDKVSPGCKECYAMYMAFRLMHIPAMKDKYEGVAKKTATGVNWTGRVNVDYPSLGKPFKLKKPTTIFVDSMSDLFHPQIPLIFIAEVFAVMWLTDCHTYQVLTKRDDRMYEVLSSDEFKIELHKAVNRLHHQYIKPLEQELYFYDEVMDFYPLFNVILGVSVEDEARKSRVDNLIKTPAVTRFLSCEPLLSSIDLSEHLKTGKIHQVIAGGESGRNARPMHPMWPVGLRDQCKKHKVGYFFKQWGEFAPGSHADIMSGNKHYIVLNNGDLGPYHKSELTKKYGNDWQNMDAHVMTKMGKKKSGRLLEGKEYNEAPVTKP